MNGLERPEPDRNPSGAERAARPVASDVAERLRAIGAQTAGVVHDVNNLLAGIDTIVASVLDRPELDGVSRADLVEVRQAVAHGAALVRRLLTTGDRPPRALRARLIDPELAAAAVTIRRLLPRGIRFSQRLEATGCRILIDPHQLHTALLNLAINARDAMGSGGTLVLRSAERVLRTPFPTLPRPATPSDSVPPGRYVVVSLRDNGPGIGPEVAARLFTPFVSAKPDGSGLGLISVRESVLKAGGFLALGGRAGHGTVARLFLPPADPPPPRDAATIWVVEDEPALRRMIGRALRGAGWRVNLAESAEAALAWVRPATRGPALLLCDLTLPGMSGPALVRLLTRRWPGLPVVMMSGYGEAPPVATAFLAKPFVLSDLTAAVAKHAREVPAES